MKVPQLRPTMSTFNGIVSEFPDIRSVSNNLSIALILTIAVDFFRRKPDVRPPLACFLSHVHSDHLAGLESLRSPLYVTLILIIPHS